MIANRLCLGIALVCLAFAAWNVHLDPVADYMGYSSGSSATIVQHSRCISVWDVWIDSTSPAPIPQPQNIRDATGPTSANLWQSACEATIVGREHIAETWFAGGVLALLIAAGLAGRQWASDLANRLADGS